MPGFIWTIIDFIPGTPMIEQLLPLELIPDTPDTEITSRINSLKKQMELTGMDGAFLTHRPDIYYFSGTAQDSWLYVPQDREPLAFVRRYLPRARLESPLDVIPIDSVKEIPDLIRDLHGRLPKTMGLAFDLVPVRDFRFYQSLFSGTKFLDATPLIEQCRAIKSQFEIRKLEAAAKVSEQVFEFMKSHVVAGISETDLAGMLEAFARTCGHSGKIQMRHYRSVGFTHHIMSGESGGLPGALDSPVCGTGTCTAYPFGAGPKLIKEDEPILVDFACMIDGYHMDESRTFVIGEMEDDAEATSRAAIEILEQIQSAMKPGAIIDDLFRMSVNIAEQMGYAGQYLGIPELKSRFVGHGIGLELVENPVLAKGRSTELLPGMVFAVEPKFIFKGRFATGIESVILITETGSRFLSRTPNIVFRV